MDYTQTIVSIGSSIITATITLWVQGKRDREKLEVGSWEFFRHVLINDQLQLLDVMLPLKYQNASQDEQFTLNFRPLNLYSSISDYVSIFASNPQVASYIMRILYEREFIANNFSGQGIQKRTIEKLFENTCKALDDIDNVILTIKEPPLSKLLHKLQSMMRSRL